MKKSVSVLFVVVLIFSVILGGCASGKKSEFDNTKWVLSGAESEGIKVSPEDMGMADFTIEFKTDGKAKLKANGETSDATFKEKGDELIVTEKGSDDMTFKLKDDKISTDMDGVTMTFKKK
jgi:hypothetical protein